MSREDVLKLVRDAVEQLRLARSPVAACVVRLPRDPPGEAVEVRPTSLERDASLGSASGGEHVLQAREVEGEQAQEVELPVRRERARRDSGVRRDMQQVRREALPGVAATGDVRESDVPPV